MWRYLHDLMFSRFDTIPECDRHTHTHTDGHTTTALAILPPSNGLDFRTADKPQNPPKCDLQSKSKPAEYIGFEIKITNQKRISKHDLRYFDLKSSPSLLVSVVQTYAAKMSGDLSNTVLPGILYFIDQIQLSHGY